MPSTKQDPRDRQRRALINASADNDAIRKGKKTGDPEARMRVAIGDNGMKKYFPKGYAKGGRAKKGCR